MADVNVQAILGNPPPPVNPLQLLSGYQAYANSVQQNRNMQQELENAKLANQTGQQALATTMAKRHAQVMFGLSNLPDDQLPGAAKQALDDELASGQIDQARYGVLSGQIDAAKGNPAALRTQINSGLVSNLAGPEALAAMAPRVVDTNIGGQIVPRVQPSPIQMLSNPGTGISNAPGAINRTLEPGYQDTGTVLTPVGGAAGQPTLGRTLTPGESATPTSGGVTRNPDGTYTQTITTVGNLNRQIGGNGSYPGGAVAGGAPTGTETKVKANIDAYNADQAGNAQHQLNVQSLQKAHDALEVVGTGVGLPGYLSTLRQYAQGVSTSTGIGLPGGVSMKDASEAELTKYLTDYARQSATGAGTNLDQQLSAKSNASGQINPQAARDVVNTNIGRERLAAAQTMTAPNEATYLNHKSGFANQYDPRGFAVDHYTRGELKAMTDKMTAPELAKFKASANLANKLGLLNVGRQNMFKGGVTQNPEPSAAQQ